MRRPKSSSDRAANHLTGDPVPLTMSVQPFGTGALSAFGQAWRKTSFVWTKDFCKQDSDGDGQSNGLELGDPCCLFNKEKLSVCRQPVRVSNTGCAGLWGAAAGPGATSEGPVLRCQSSRRQSRTRRFRAR
jgi:hypothetical protein